MVELPRARATNTPYCVLTSRVATKSITRENAHAKAHTGVSTRPPHKFQPHHTHLSPPHMLQPITYESADYTRVSSPRTGAVTSASAHHTRQPPHPEHKTMNPTPQNQNSKPSTPHPHAGSLRRPRGTCTLCSAVCARTRRRCRAWPSHAKECCKVRASALRFSTHCLGTRSSSRR